ncbi:MAG: hypothetical protein ABH864_07405 [archaeon]
MNRKGIVIGKAITSIVVTIAVVFIMGTFVIIAAGVAQLKSPEIEKARLISQDRNDILLRLIGINSNEETKELLIYDAVVLFENDLLEKEDLVNALKKIVTSEEPCLLIAKSLNENPAGMTGGEARDDIFIKRLTDGGYLEGHTGSTPSSGLDYKNANLLSKTQFKNNKGETVYVEYYLGDCIE